MEKVKPRTQGLRVTLSTGTALEASLSEDGTCACFQFNPHDRKRPFRFALSDEALAAMLQLRLELQAREQGKA